MAQTDFSRVLTAVERDGFAVLQDVADSAEVAAIRTEVETIAASRPAWLKRVTVADPTRLFIHFSPLSVRRLGDTSRISHVTRAFGAPVVNTVNDHCLGSNWYFERIIVDRSGPAQDALSSWHTDRYTFDRICLKYMLYLSDTTAQNGAFSYVPGSHRLIKALRAGVKGMSDTTKHLAVFDDYPKIKQMTRQLIADCLQHGRAGEAAEFERILATMEAHIRTGTDSDDHFSVAARSGSIVVFDTAGWHRGGVVQSGERFIVRSHCPQATARHVLSSKNELVAFLMRIKYRNLGRAESAFV